MPKEVFSGAGAQSGTIEFKMADKPSLMVKIASGTPAWTLLYQGSPDGIKWTTMLTHTDIDQGDGETLYPGSARFPCTYRRLFCSALSGGTIEAIGYAT